MLSKKHFQKAPSSKSIAGSSEASIKIRQNKTLIRSKTESSIKLEKSSGVKALSQVQQKETNKEKPPQRVGHGGLRFVGKPKKLGLKFNLDDKSTTIASNEASGQDFDHKSEASTFSQTNTSSDYQPGVCTSEVLKVRKSLIPKLSPQCKKPSKFEDPQLEQPSVLSKVETKSGGSLLVPSQFKSSRRMSTKATTKQLHYNHDRKINRSKTESSIDLGNIRKVQSYKEKAPPQVKPKGPDRDANGTATKQRIQEKQDVVSPEFVDSIAGNLNFPKESSKTVPHSGLRFIRKKNKFNLNFNTEQEKSSPKANKEDSALQEECLKEGEKR